MASATTNGTLEVCKADTGGAKGVTFQFKVVRLSNSTSQTISVEGGKCSALPRAAGNYRVQEVAKSGWSVASITVDPAANTVVAANLAQRKVTVKVRQGQDTTVTVANQGDKGFLKVCKTSSDPSTRARIDAFRFTVAGSNGTVPGGSFQLTAGTTSNPGCSAQLGPFPAGTRLTVTEAQDALSDLTSITVNPATRGSAIDLVAQSVVVTTGAGVTQATFNNEVKPPPTKGFIEVCKQSTGQFPVSGLFTFTITPSSGPVINRSVAVGQCTPALEVAAGNVTVTQAAVTGTVLDRVEVAPASRLVDQNLTNRSVVVSVPNDPDQSNETLVTFFNKAVTGQFKVCKTLAANSGALAGQPFTFNIPGVGTVTVIAGQAGETVCSTPITLAVGTAVSITENPVANVAVLGVVVSPASNDRGSSGSTANIVIGSGVTSVTFTNQALGTIEVCKNALDSSTAQAGPFQFQVNGGPAFGVKPGECSGPIRVPAGTATVLELQKANYQLAFVTATGDRLLSSSTANPAIVSVPFGGVSNETVVTFYNKVQRTGFKICKQILDSDLAGDTITFDVSVTGDGAGSLSLTAPSVGGIACTAFIDGFPVVNPDQQAPQVTVTERQTAAPLSEVTSITVDPTDRLVSSNLALRQVVFKLGAGTATVATFTDDAVDATPPVA